MTYGLRFLLALAAVMSMASVASAAPADKSSSLSASVVGATRLAPPANLAFQRELVGTTRADERIVLAQRVRRGGRGVVVRRGRRGRGVGTAAAVTLGILGAAALAAGAANASPRYRAGPSRCERWDRLCYRGEGWACRRLRRECY